MILQQPFAISKRRGIFSSPISINAAQVPSTQTDFPVLVSQTDNRFKTIANGGHVANSSGFDIRPYSDSGLTTAITGYELERYNATTGEVIMWVKVASLSSSTTPIYLRYGDPTITTDGSSTTTWSNSFYAVYHLKDGTTLSLTDSTSNALTLTNNNTATAATGQIDGSVGLASASSQYLNKNTGFAATPSTAMTLSAWVKGTSFPNAVNTVATTYVTSYQFIGVRSDGKLIVFVHALTDISYDGTGATTLSTGTWYHLVITYSSAAGLVGYVNASVDKTVAANGTTSNATGFSIGRDMINTGLNRYWNGSIDEVRFVTTVRSADWITTEYNNQSAPGTFETLGTEV